MTHIRLYQSPGGRLSGFSVIGHSGSAPSGEDIVCAGISALAITAANALETVGGISARLHSGDGFLSVRLPGGLSSRQAFIAQVILRTAQQGFFDIHAAHPHYVRISGINQREVQPCFR